MAYLDDVRERILGLLDAQLPKTEVRKRISVMFADEVRRSFWSGARFAVQRTRQQQVKQ